ncbi:MAG: CotH kinase family protein [Calditrichaceae bacterium]|nr:CotH kinase family protein [Calditrichaceae bacterium]MBN2710188.1 CotH kinase family protein [Calditrichaceae bacterium]RQV94162.1 MAG: T9SS C-terminal target domain-containing protein [Calditrichota bacterium]
MKSIFYIFLFTISVYEIQAADESWMVFDDTEVAEIKVTMDTSALNWMMADENVESDSMHLAHFTFSNKWVDEAMDSIGIRLRGNTSRESGKKSFKLSFNTFIRGQEFYDLDKMNINGEHNDPSVVRSKLCWDLFNKTGLTASRAFYAALYINEEYFGLYIVVEHIDDEFLNKNYADDSGNLWKCLWPADLVFIDSDPDAYKYFNETSNRYPYELKTNEEINDYTQLARFIDILNNTPEGAIKDSLERIIYPEEVLKYMAVNVLTGSWDDYWYNQNNFYIYHEPAADRFHLIPYDYDNTFGISWFSTDWTDINPYYFAEFEGQQGSRPLIDRILNIPSYRNLYTHFLEHYLLNVFNLDIMEDRIDSLHTLIEDPWVMNDPFYPNSYGFTIDDFNNSYSEAGYYFDPHVRRGLKEYINLRVASLNSQLEYVSAPPALYHPSWSTLNPAPDESVFVDISIFDSDGIHNAAVVLMIGGGTSSYILSENKIPGSSRVELADRWSGSIPPVGEGFSGGFYFIAQDKKGQTTRYPVSGFFPLLTGTSAGEGLVINEFLADNVSSNTDQDDEFDDWLELFNTGDDSVLISGKYLSDNPLSLNKWQIPGDNVYLHLGEYLLVWCDEDDQQGLHANFKLSKSGEFIALTASDGITVLDSITFGPQDTDMTFGRSPDGSENWVKMTPTPGAANISTAIKQSEEYLPGRFSLKLYPNPFNSTVIMEYDLPKTGSVQLEVFNTLGQMVRAENLGYKEAGSHKLPVSMEQASSGMYFLHLKAGSQKIVRKILLIR